MLVGALGSDRGDTEGIIGLELELGLELGLGLEN